MAEADDFAMDSSVAPGRVLGCEANDESADLDGSGWPSRPSCGLRPVAGDSAAMPAQERVGRDEPAIAAVSGECGGDRAEQGPVLISECRSVVLAAQDRELVA